MNTKKISSFLLNALLFTVLFSGLFISCDFLVDGDSKYSFKPDVSIAKGGDAGINVFSRYRSDTTDYIYIYRKNTSVVNSTAENIGIINQNAFKGNNTFNFQDQFVTSGKKYKYYVVYHDSLTNEYFTSSASNEITAESGYGALAYDTTSSDYPSKVTYDTKSYSLTLPTGEDFNKMPLKDESGNATSPLIDDYIPTLVLNRYELNGSSKINNYSRYFPLEDLATLKAGSTLDHVNLRDLVSDDFVTLNPSKPVMLSIPGLVGMKIEYVKDAAGKDTSVIQTIYFTSISKIDKNNTVLSDFKITSYQGTGIYLPPSPGSTKK